MEKADQVRLNHELLIWVGFTLTNGVWSYPDGVTVDNGVPYFPESLDEIFKWLVPKLHTLKLYVDTQNDWNSKPFAEVYTETEGYEGNAETPALALCLAIQKLIRSKGVNQ